MTFHKLPNICIILGASMLALSLIAVGHVSHADEDTFENDLGRCDSGCNFDCNKKVIDVGDAGFITKCGGASDPPAPGEPLGDPVPGGGCLAVGTPPVDCVKCNGCKDINPGPAYTCTCNKL